MTKKIVILGAGESGTGAAILAKAKGFDVFVSDSGIIPPNSRIELHKHDIDYEAGRHTEERVFAADEVIKSPGIPLNIPIIQKLKDLGIPVIDEIEFAFRYTRAKFIGITGSNGKTTTTLMTYHLMKEAGMDVGLAGNVGHSLAKQVAENDREWFVVELSSFQLDSIEQFKPDIAVLLNITPDHLNRYDGDFEKYIESKLRITRNLNEQDSLVYFAQDKVLSEIVPSLDIGAAFFPIFKTGTPPGSGAYHLGEELFFSQEQGTFSVDKIYLPLAGEHNLVNALAAIQAATLAGVDPNTVGENLKTFKNQPHRMEYITTINGVDFVNDTKATNVDAVYFALGSYNQPITWVAGGQDKGNDYDLIRDLAKEKVKALVCLGLDNAPLTSYFEKLIPNISETQDVKEAARMAYEYSVANDVVLLSPACASFDLFENYAKRGDLFKEAVWELKNELEPNPEAI